MPITSTYNVKHVEGQGIWKISLSPMNTCYFGGQGDESSGGNGGVKSGGNCIGVESGVVLASGEKKTPTRRKVPG